VKFGPVPVGQAAGAILAHSLGLPGGTLKKGIVLGPREIARLREAGMAEVTVARLDGDDVHEDEAARAVAEALGGEGVTLERAFTGRANLFAGRAGVLRVLPEAVRAANSVDEAITVATLPQHAAVEAGRMVATVKIIPYAVPRASLAAVLEALAAHGPALSVAPFRPLRVALVSTRLPGTPEKVLDKTLRTLADRLAPAGATISAERRVAHEVEALTGALRELAGHDLVVVYGASAIADRRDVIPAAIEAAGGEIEHFGMPVDPGNLLALARIGGTPVLGAPGCARSPKENGFDWVLQRLLAGVAVTREDLVGMGVGGLLMEIVTRPQPREGGAPAPAENAGSIAAVLLAAGQSRRMGGPNKLLATLEGRPLVRIAAEAALASRARPVVVVTGHQAEEVRAALAGLDLLFVHNPGYAEGLSGSLRAGLGALGPEVEGALVMLSDMPEVTSAAIDRLIDAYDPAGGALIVVPTAEGRRGNPVLWSRRFFEPLMRVEGDVGGRHLIGTHAEVVAEVEIGRAVALDLDTPEALAAAGAVAR